MTLLETKSLKYCSQAVQWEDDKKYLWARQFSRSLGSLTGGGEIKQKRGKKTRPPGSPFVKCSEPRLILFRSGQGKRENKVYLPDSSLFHIYDEVHQGSACGHPERQEMVGEERDQQKLSKSTPPTPGFLSVTVWWDSKPLAHLLCEENLNLIPQLKVASSSALCLFRYDMTAF